MFGVDAEIRNNASEMIALLEPIVRQKCHRRLGAVYEKYRRTDVDVVALLAKPAGRG